MPSASNALWGEAHTEGVACEVKGTAMEKTESSVNTVTAAAGELPKKIVKKVEYIELFFDLIFVYSFRSINSLFHHVEEGFPSAALMGSFFFLMMVAVQVWFFSTMFFNRYGRKSLRDYISILINMYFLYYMASDSMLDWTTHYVRYHVAWACIMLNLSYRSLDKLRHGSHIDDVDRHILQSNCSAEFFQAGLAFATIPIYQATGIMISPLVLLFGFAAKWFEYRYYKLRPVDFPHLSERVLLLVILTFGEMIIGISAYFDAGDQVLMNVSAFLVVVLMFLSYGFFYDNALYHQQKTSGLGYLTRHVFLICAINTTTIALELGAREGINKNYRLIFLILCMFAYYGFMMTLVRYRKWELADTRGFIGITVLMMGVYGICMLYAGGTPHIAFLVTVLYCLLNLLLRFRDYHRQTGKKLHFGSYLE